MSPDRIALGADLDQFTTDQRRRAEALLLVRFLYPSISVGTTAIGLARWVSNGSAP